LAIAEKVLGPDHPVVGVVLTNIAHVYEAQGRRAEAEPLHKRALAIRERALEPDLKSALIILENALGPDHLDVGTSLNNLAELYRVHGRYAEAEPLFRRALAIQEKVLGPNHPNVGTSLNNLAKLYRAQGQHAAAEPLLKRALAIEALRKSIKADKASSTPARRPVATSTSKAKVPAKPKVPGKTKGK
jgi:tetratricopeptide (TPR) repeat protein